VLMGTQVKLAAFLDGRAVALGVALIVVGVVGKLVTGLGVVGRGTRRLAVGIGMVPRGEVGLIFAGVGAGLTVGGAPLLGSDVFPALVAMVLVTTVITPPALAWVFRGRARP